MEDGLLVGYDFGKRYTQISCFNRKTLEPDTIGMKEGTDGFLIPTVLGVTKESHEWLFGREAVEKANEGEAELIEDLLKVRPVTVCGREFLPEYLLEKFFRKTLALLTAYYPNGRIEKLIVSVENIDVPLITAVYTAMETIGLHRDRVSVISRMQSYFYYALSQKKNCG